MSEDTSEQKKFPKSVILIVCNEFCERFTFYGMRTILVIYLSEILLYDNKDTTVIFHTFSMLCYFFPLIGAIIADSWTGKYKTIVYLSIVYVIGIITISFSSSPKFGLPQRPLSLLGLLLIAIGTGGIKPCVSTFGGDQFMMPEQKKQIEIFFSTFYFAINAGALLSSFLTPILRKEVHCLGAISCYPLAFGIPAVLMIIAVVIFVSGTKIYIIRKPQGNIFFQVAACIGYAIATKVKNKGTKKEHWLDFAEDKYSNKLISDIKVLLQVLVLYIPFPLFWALYDQQGSRWTIQATQMDGRLGSFYTIKPDQMIIVNALMILVFIPLFEYVVYPALGVCKLLTRPLQRLATGGFLAAVSFIASAIVETQLEGTSPILPEPGTGQLRLYNGINCNGIIASQIESFPNVINNLGVLEAKQIPFENREYQLTITFGSNCGSDSGKSWSGHVSIVNSEAVSYFITNSNENKIAVKKVPGNDVLTKSINSYPQIRILYNLQLSGSRNFKLVNNGLTKQFNLQVNEFNTTQEILLRPGKFTAYIDSNKINDFNFEPGGVYTLIIEGSGNTAISANLLETSPPNTVHMLWLLPQYIIITAAEIMFSITGLEFSYTQAPASMKSLITAIWLLTTSLGNLIVVGISEAKFFRSQIHEFLLFSALMTVDMIIFVIIAIFFYTYKIQSNRDDD